MLPEQTRFDARHPAEMLIHMANSGVILRMSNGGRIILFREPKKGFTGDSLDCQFVSVAVLDRGYIVVQLAKTVSNDTIRGGSFRDGTSFVEENTAWLSYDHGWYGFREDNFHIVTKDGWEIDLIPTEKFKLPYEVSGEITQAMLAAAIE
jgi:hypothetical protein